MAIKKTCISRMIPGTNKMLAFILVMLGVLSAREACAETEQLRFKQLGIDNGLYHYYIRAILKDSRSFIWVATGFGLNRFDGYTVKSFFRDLQKSVVQGVSGASLVVCGPVLQYSSEKPLDPLTVCVFPDKNASIDVYEDEGTNYNYENGKGAAIPISHTM